VPVAVGEHRERLLAIKFGQITFEKVEQWRLELHQQFDAAFESTRLPSVLTTPPPTNFSSAPAAKPRRRAHEHRPANSPHHRRPSRIHWFSSPSAARTSTAFLADSDYDLRGAHILPPPKFLA